MVPRPRRSLFSIAAALLVGALFCCGSGLRQDEIDCEEAVAHLQTCCPGFDPSHYSCEYVEGCESNTLPQFSIQQAACIRDLSCGALQRQGVCDRAYTVTNGGTICP